MQSNGSRVVALLVAAAVIIALFFAFRGGGDDDATTATEAAATATTTTGDGGGDERGDGGHGGNHGDHGNGGGLLVPTIEVVNGKPKDGVTELAFEQGDEIRFAVTSDSADEVHVHGYDVEAEVGPGEKAVLDFPADLEGVFEVELHHSGAQIAELTIKP